MIDFKGHRFERDIILLCVRWYLSYPLSYRNLKEMMLERGVEVDHSNIYRWVQKFTPQLEAAFRKGEKRAVGNSWRMDETYIKIKGQWKGAAAQRRLQDFRHEQRRRPFPAEAHGQHEISRPQRQNLAFWARTEGESARSPPARRA
jgi:transposase-like protein